jgi:hypothetical protein
MFHEKAIAQKISGLRLEISGQLDGSVAFVAENCSTEELEGYAQTIGSIMGIIGLDILNRLYTDFPEIKPQEYSL